MSMRPDPEKENEVLAVTLKYFNIFFDENGEDRRDEEGVCFSASDNYLVASKNFFRELASENLLGPVCQMAAYKFYKINKLSKNNSWDFLPLIKQEQEIPVWLRALPGKKVSFEETVTNLKRCAFFCAGPDRNFTEHDNRNTGVLAVAMLQIIHSGLIRVSDIKQKIAINFIIAYLSLQNPAPVSPIHVRAEPVKFVENSSHMSLSVNHNQNSDSDITDNPFVFGFFMFLHFGWAFFQLIAGTAGLVNSLGWFFGLLCAIASFFFLRLPIVFFIGVFLCAKNIFEWHWFPSLALAFPSLIIVALTLLSSAESSLYEKMRRR